MSSTGLTRTAVALSNVIGLTTAIGAASDRDPGANSRQATN
jgi:hypothetical protein